MATRLEPDKRIPEKLREIYAHLAGNLIETYGALKELMFLFGTSENVKLLNETAPSFFVHHERLLVDHIILSLSRMTDEKGSGSGTNTQENLSLPRLLELPDAKYQQLRTDLQKKWTEIKGAAKELRTYRHKFLAHADLAHHLSPSSKLGADISIGSIRKLLDHISDFLNTFDYFFTNVETTSYHPPATYGDESDLIAYIKLAIETENKIQNDRLRAADEASAG
jgi:AbiU2